MIEEPAMPTPGFTAASALAERGPLHRPETVQAAASEAVQPAFHFRLLPSVQGQYVPSRELAGHGTLLITGQNFTPGDSVEVRVDNCDAFPYKTTLSVQPSGGFSTSFPCACGGSASIHAFDPQTMVSADNSTPLPC
jgi:hypothetical protein